MLKAKAAVVAAVIGLGLAAPAQAAVKFSDNFDSYAPGLNWTPPAGSHWSVPVGSVDLIGQGTEWNWFAGHGGYVDLAGSTGAFGTLQTLDSFAAGTYVLTFELAGNQRSDGYKTTTITLGDYSYSINLADNAPLKSYTLKFTTTGGKLSFGEPVGDMPMLMALSGGNPNIGNILDDVSLAAVPEPAAWAMLLVGFGVLGGALRLRRATAMA